MSSQSSSPRKGGAAAQGVPQITPAQRKKFLRWTLIIIAAVIVFNFISPIELWNLVILRPMLNGLVLFYGVMGRSFILSVTALVVIVRLLMLPLTLKQLRASRAMQEVQPELARLKKKYGGNKERLSKEQMALYQEKGINPAGGCLPTLVQLPIWIGMYQSVTNMLAHNPSQLLSLSKLLYMRFPLLSQLVPIDNHLLWLNLAEPDRLLILPILVGVTQWVTGKMMAAPTGGDSQQQAMGQSMQTFMPIFFAWMMTSWPSGFGVYFVISNIVGIAIQYFTTGPGGLLPRRAGSPAKREASGAALQAGGQKGSEESKRGKADGAKKR